MFPGRFRRRKSDSLGPRPASVSSLRARVHTHVDAQHEAGHLTQAASAEQINRRTDTARVSERPRPGGNAGQYMQAENSSQDVPLQGVVLFCQPISLAKQNHPLGGFDRPFATSSPTRTRRRRRRAWQPWYSLLKILVPRGRGDNRPSMAAFTSSPRGEVGTPGRRVRGTAMAAPISKVRPTTTLSCLV